MFGFAFMISLLLENKDTFTDSINDKRTDRPAKYSQMLCYYACEICVETKKALCRLAEAGIGNIFLLHIHI